MIFPTTFSAEVYNILYIMFLQRFSNTQSTSYTYQDYKNSIIYLTSWFNNITIYELFVEFKENRLSIFKEFEKLVVSIFFMDVENINNERKLSYDDLNSNRTN